MNLYRGGLLNGLTQRARRCRGRRSRRLAGGPASRSSLLPGSPEVGTAGLTRTSAG